MTGPLTDAERRLAEEWANGEWLGDDWTNLLRRVLDSEAYWKAEAERARGMVSRREAEGASEQWRYPDVWREPGDLNRG